MVFLDNFDESIRDGLYAAAEMVRKHKKVQLFSHYDADGVTSMAIVKAALEREGIETVYKNYPTLTRDQMEDVRRTEFECMVMTDLGTSFLPDIMGLGKDCVVLDHHSLPEPMPEISRIVFVNPWSAGVNGSEHSCAATVAFLFAMALSEENFDLCQIAIAGMIGDYQHKSGFDKYNKIVVDEAIRRGPIMKMDSICAIGNIADYLSMTIDPYYRGYTGKPEKCAEILKGLPEELELGNTELATTIDKKLIAILREKGCSERSIAKIPRTRYYLRDYGVDAGCFSDVLDACGRSGRADLALEVISKRDISLGMGCFLQFRKKIIEQLNEVENEGIHEMKNLQYFTHHTRSSGGFIATVVLNYLGSDTKPVIALMDEGSFINLSSRSNQMILDMGVSLNTVLRAIQEKHGAQCGGHPMASGGNLLPGTMDAFLKDLDDEIGRVIASHSLSTSTD